MGGKIRSGLTTPDLGETFLISSPVHFAFTLHKYAKSPAPPHLTLPALALSPLSHRKKQRVPGRRREKSEPGREREREREREKLTAAFDPSTASMAGDIVVIEADPWDPSDVTIEML